MKYLKCLVLVMLLAGWGGSVMARDVTVDVVAPTEYTDGTPVEAGDVSGYKFSCKDVLALGVYPVTPAVTVVGVPKTGCDLVAMALDKDGYESDFSNVLVIERLKLKPPTLMQVVVAWFKSKFGWLV